MTEFEKIKKHIVNKLGTRLPSYLTYHNVEHTLDVLNQATILANEEGIASEEDIFLLKVSALYHDTGFISIYNGHEEKSCEIAKNELGKFGFDEKQIDKICGMIRATKIPQQPRNHLEKIICDADLDYLGRSDFFTTGGGLYKEFLHQKIVMNELEWNQLQVNFLEKHTYFTHSSKVKRDNTKQTHLDEVKRKVALVE